MRGYLAALVAALVAGSSACGGSDGGGNSPGTGSGSSSGGSSSGGSSSGGSSSGGSSSGGSSSGGSGGDVVYGGCTLAADFECTEVSGPASAQLEAAFHTSCTNSEANGGAGGTWSSACSTANLVGTCTLLATQGVFAKIFFYTGSSGTAADMQAACTSAGGTWAP